LDGDIATRVRVADGMVFVLFYPIIGFLEMDVQASCAIA
jgi:hypothetical protein